MTPYSLLHRASWLVLLFLAGLCGSARADDVRLAVSYFEDSSNRSDMAPLARGLAQMLITDLSGVKGLTLVEREQLDAVLAEIDLQQSPWADPATAVELGRGMGADLLLTGSYVAQGQTLRVDARVIDVQSAEVVVSVKSLGASKDFLAVERDLATRLLEGLGIELTVLDKTRIGKGSTTDIEALSHYSTGLGRLDAGDPAGAVEAFSRAANQDPDFEIAAREAKRVRALLAEADEALDARKQTQLAEWHARNRCACAHAPDLDGTRPPLDGLSAGERVGRRLMLGGQSGLFSEVSATPHYAMSVSLVQLGMFEEADALLDALESSDFVRSLPATWSAPNAELTKLGVKQSNRFRFWDEALFQSAQIDRDAMLRVHQCAVHQARSYRYYRSLDLEKAMAEQVRAAAIPTPDERSRRRLQHCMEGELWRSAPIGIQGPLRAAIERASSDSVVRQRLAVKRDLIQARVGKVRAQIEETARSLSCESLCPWP